MSKSNSICILFIFHVVIYLIGHAKITLGLPLDDPTNVYIVYLGERQHDDPKRVTDSHYDMLSTIMDSEQLALESMVYSYCHGFSGFAAKLTEFQAQLLSEQPDVVSVMPNSLYELQTTRSWDYLGLSPQTPNNLLDKTNMGDGTIIGVLDSGIWPESKSFSDEGLGAIPSGWKGFCKSGERFDASKHCNKKIIGARWYADGIAAALGPKLNLSSLGEILSARDVEGHGTHVSSTAAGSFVANVSYDRVGLGTARGGAPRARLAVYKVCWKLPNGVCASADILKAFDDAIRDGVHVLTLSVGASSLPLYSEVDGRDTIAIGSFHAVQRGITVVCAAGNSGPLPQTVTNIAPWIITVAASTMDRAFKTEITLGNNKSFMADSIYTGSKQSQFSGLFYPGEMDSSQGVCEGLSSRDSRVAGKIVLCFTTVSNPLVTLLAALIVRAAGGAGVIVSKIPNDITGRCGQFPCAEVDYEIGTHILYYIRSTKNPRARLSPPTTLVGKAVSADIVEFSSRGPNSVAPSILKPDIAAPGVQIIAATSVLDTSSQQGFTMLSGTSMSTPHVAGIVALLRSLYPNWSPAAIRSALTTTGTIFCSLILHTKELFGLEDMIYKIDRNIHNPSLKTLHHFLRAQCIKSGEVVRVWKEGLFYQSYLSYPPNQTLPNSLFSDHYFNKTEASTTDSNGIPLSSKGASSKPADPFDFGGGIANPNAASRPGLVYDADITDYTLYLCAMGYENANISKLIGRPTACPDKAASILDLNLPSITIPHLRNSTTLTRTVTNVGAVNAIYRVMIEPPVGTFVFVTPPVLIFSSKMKKISFKVTVTSMHQHSGGFNFGSIVWTDGMHHVRSPVAVRSAMAAP